MGAAQKFPKDGPQETVYSEDISLDRIPQACGKFFKEDWRTCRILLSKKGGPVVDIVQLKIDQPICAFCCQFQKGSQKKLTKSTAPSSSKPQNFTIPPSAFPSSVSPVRSSIPPPSSFKSSAVQNTAKRDSEDNPHHSAIKCSPSFDCWRSPGAGQGHPAQPGPTTNRRSFLCTSFSQIQVCG